MSDRHPSLAPHFDTRGFVPAMDQVRAQPEHNDGTVGNYHPSGRVMIMEGIGATPETQLGLGSTADRPTSVSSSSSLDWDINRGQSRGQSGVLETTSPKYKRDDGNGMNLGDTSKP